MDSDERDIFQFLKTQGVEFTSPREVARRAGGKQKFYEDPEWARPLLGRMHERGILEMDAQGRFRIKPVAQKGKGKRWVAPDIAKILQESGVEAEDTNEGKSELGSDEYYEQL